MADAEYFKNLIPNVVLSDKASGSIYEDRWHSGKCSLIKYLDLKVEEG
jgi:hypothetical protein